MNYKTRQPFPNAAYVEGQRNFTYFDRSLTSGLTDVVIESPGDFLYIDQASTGVVSVELNMRQGGTLAPILLAAGGSIDCDFASIKINATAQSNKTVRIIVGNGAKIKGGANVQSSSAIMQTVSGGVSFTNADQAKIGFAYCPPVAATYGHVQIHNGLGTGKQALITKIAVTLGVAGFFQVRRHNATLANPMGVLNPASKKLYGAAGVTTLRYENNAAWIGTGPMYQSYGAATSPVYFNFDEPILIDNTHSLIINNGNLGQDIAANFELLEL